MAEDRQPPNVTEGATAAGDVEEEMQPKSAEDRKAAAALSKLDARGDDESAAPAVDNQLVKNAMDALGGGGAAKAEVKKVKVDAADVNLLVDQLELSKPKATELLKAHDGSAVTAMRAWLQPTFA
ncbi:hypothetical protein QBC37DRAFT_395941 [Rhypophila decipiens]|uniref:Nascent polypeptide-associated complex subunit alpha-like UBA domain-containing protein n=1 Tax=Rhypophila decipiens TaxID=261697 RepID=A0AAN7BCG3_9PEZI|nr:hypothetical protein QBC37DRAFT_395941 [Rhypophila decipiens]